MKNILKNLSVGGLNKSYSVAIARILTALEVQHARLSMQFFGVLCDHLYYFHVLLFFSYVLAFLSNGLEFYLKPSNSTHLKTIAQANCHLVRMNFLCNGLWSMASQFKGLSEVLVSTPKLLDSEILLPPQKY